MMRLTYILMNPWISRLEGGMAHIDVSGSSPHYECSLGLMFLTVCKRKAHKGLRNACKDKAVVCVWTLQLWMS
jgi:hypothetical protein